VTAPWAPLESAWFIARESGLSSAPRRISARARAAFPFQSGPDTGARKEKFTRSASHPPALPRRRGRG
jgi:hypothetical protein